MARARQTDKDRKDHARRVCKALERAYPEAACALLHSRSLSASGCHDPVGAVHRRPREHGDARALPPVSGFRQLWRRPIRASSKRLIRSTGFFRAKSRNLLAMARQGGRGPRWNHSARSRALTALPGVGRKTANVVLGTAFGIASGVVVDTHVKRLARRLGLALTDDSGADRARADAGRPARRVGRFEPSADPPRPARLPGAASAMRDLFAGLDLPQDRRGCGSRRPKKSKHSAEAVRKGRSGSTAGETVGYSRSKSRTTSAVRTGRRSYV